MVGQIKTRLTNFVPGISMQKVVNMQRAFAMIFSNSRSVLARSDKKQIKRARGSCKIQFWTSKWCMTETKCLL